METLVNAEFFFFLIIMQLELLFHVLSILMFQKLRVKKRKGWRRSRELHVESVLKMRRSGPPGKVLILHKCTYTLTLSSLNWIYSIYGCCLFQMVPAGHKSLYRNLRLDLHRWILWQEVLWPPWYLLISWEKSKGFGTPLVSPSPGPYHYLLTKSLYFLFLFSAIKMWVIDEWFSELSN